MIRLRRTHKLISLAVVVLTLSYVGYRVYDAQRSKTDTKPTNQIQAGSEQDQTTPTRQSIRLLIAGDFIAHDSLNAAAKQPDGTYNYMPLMSGFDTLFKKSDIRFCNDPILNGGESLGISGYPKFNSPTDFVTDMNRLGCNLVNTASNHSFDFSQKNIDESVKAWDGIPGMLAVAGQNRTQAEHDTVHYFDLKGVKFAFLAYTSYSNAVAANAYGVNSFTQDFASSQIETAKKAGAQFIIASMRWGTEYSKEVNGLQRQQAQFLADQGVNLIIGHGPHVLQPVQQLTGSKQGQKTTVFYSVGNFVHTQEPAETLFNGLPIVDIEPKSQVLSIVGFLPIYMHYEWTAAQAAADQVNARSDVRLYLLENATQAMIDAQQLHTTIDLQKQRIQTTLNALGQTIPLITSSEL